MRFRAVIFDLDGTLADTLSDIAEAMNRALEAHDLPTLEPDAYRTLVGEGVERLVKRAVPTDRPELIGPVLDDLKRYYTEHMLDRTTAYSGIPELLDRLTERQIPMAIVSNKPEPATRWMVERMFDRWHFAAVVGGTDGVPLKPDPTAVLKIAGDLGIEPLACVYLGDTMIDMQTAVAAGMYPVGALWGFRDRDELLAHGAKALVTEPLDLLALLNSDR
ncbi:MAG: HAD family hydrolase [Gemmatimonadetes bacterium]|nr:HAD family hydrolase [Gemmatimonadota bacterium]